MCQLDSRVSTLVFFMEKSEPTHLTPVREQGPKLMGQNVTLIEKCLLQSKLNHTINHSWSHDQYIQYVDIVVYILRLPWQWRTNESG